MLFITDATFHFNKLNKAQQKEIRDNYNKYRYIWKK